ncbi:MAG: patatin-like phospholipase family protein [Chitinophagaceae bacterium]|nr:MAG: patatin-like phospholipase family protein [Chitinophagaceae bacterium]
MSKPANEIGLSLSGGGYRATAFHLGTLRKLQSLGILQKVDVISTISGGSITGAYYALHKDDFDYFSSSLYDKLLHNNVISKVIWSRTFLQAILFCVFFLGAAVYFLLKGPAWVAPLVLLVWLILLGLFQFRIFPVSRRIERVYDQFFYHKKTLGDLPENPKLVIGSTKFCR